VLGGVVVVVFFFLFFGGGGGGGVGGGGGGGGVRKLLKFQICLHPINGLSDREMEKVHFIYIQFTLLKFVHRNFLISLTGFEIITKLLCLGYVSVFLNTCAYVNFHLEISASFCINLVFDGPGLGKLINTCQSIPPQNGLFEGCEFFFIYSRCRTARL